MKRYMLSILPLFLALCLMAGCGGRSPMHRRLAAGDVSMATINIKLNWLIGILSAIGAAVLTAVLKVMF